MGFCPYARSVTCSTGNMNLCLSGLLCVDGRHNTSPLDPLFVYRHDDDGCMYIAMLLPMFELCVNAA